MKNNSNKSIIIVTTVSLLGIIILLHTTQNDKKQNIPEYNYTNIVKTEDKLSSVDNITKKDNDDSDVEAQDYSSNISYQDLRDDVKELLGDNKEETNNNYYYGTVSSGSSVNQETLNTVAEVINNVNTIEAHMVQTVGTELIKEKMNSQSEESDKDKKDKESTDSKDKDKEKDEESKKDPSVTINSEIKDGIVEINSTLNNIDKNVEQILDIMKVVDTPNVDINKDKIKENIKEEMNKD